jgi:SnoaL-like domain
VAGALDSDEFHEVAHRLAILQLEAEYARTWDSQDADGWAACFTDDGAFEMGSVPGGLPAMRFAGRAQLTEFCRIGSGRYEGIHLLSAPSLTFASTPDDDGGARVWGWVHFSYFDRDRKTDAVRHVVGVYAVTYVRADDGAWRMALRREQAVMTEHGFHGFPTADRMWAPEVS